MKAKMKSGRAKKIVKNKPAKKGMVISRLLFKFDKRVFIVIAFLLFISSATFLILKKDLVSEEIIKYAFFSLIIYLLIVTKEKIKRKD